MTDREKLIDLMVEAARKRDREYSDFQAKKLLIETPILLANGVTIQRWIPVTERLPKYMECVLAFSDDGGISMAMLVSEERFAGFYTHWMPLPKPPKEVE